MSDVKANERLIVALDVDTKQQAEEIVDALDDLVSFYKVGWQLFLGTHFTVVTHLHQLGKKVFLDLKMEDIPETVELAMRNAPEFIELMTLKGTSQLIQAAKQGASAEKRVHVPKFLMLTVLSSQDDDDVRELYGQSATRDSLVMARAQRALAAGCDGLIASGESVRRLREAFGQAFLIVAPGIRPKGGSTDDHKRTLTPCQAIIDGADYIVVGRPITKAKDRRRAAEEIVSDIGSGLSERQSAGNGGSGGGSGFPPRMAAAAV